MFAKIQFRQPVTAMLMAIGTAIAIISPVQANPHHRCRFNFQFPQRFAAHQLVQSRVTTLTPSNSSLLHPPTPIASPQASLVLQPVSNVTIKPHRLDRVALGAQVETVSGAAEIALAEYLATTDVKFYGAYWCSHCQKQKSLFGAVAASKLPYVECAADGENSQRQLCKDKNIKMFPTWVIDGKYHSGTIDLAELAKLTGYEGSIKFKYRK